MTIVQSVILGIVQGLAEFLPISSSGHLILARALLGMEEAVTQTGAYMMFDILLHLGTLLAVIVVFWRDWWGILRNPFKSKTLLLLIIASIPALIVALLLNDVIEGMFTGWFLGVSFLITGLFLVIAQRLGRRGRHAATQETPGYKNAVSMGVMQAVALLPGVSRSGSTLLGGIASGLTRKAAAKFSFMMSAPAILGSLLIEGRTALKEGYFAQLELVPTLLGMAAATICGFLAIRLMLRLIAKVSLNWFALYVGILGIAVILIQLFTTGILPPLAFPVAEAKEAARAMVMLL